MEGGRKAGVGLIMAFLVLAGLLVVADRAAASMAEDRIAQQVAQRAADKDITMRGEPEVTVEGFPFLTQVIGGEYEAISIRMRGLSLDGINVDSLEITATGVAADLGDVMDGSGQVRASRLTGTVTLPFSAVEESLGMDGAKVSGKAGRLVIRAPFNYGAGSVTAIAHAKITASNGALRVKVTEVAAADGQVPSYAEPALDALAGKLSRRVAMPPLPYGLKLDSANVTDSGVAVVLSAQDVPLAS